jgi:hypothetical protein
MLPPIMTLFTQGVATKLCFMRTRLESKDRTLSGTDCEDPSAFPVSGTWTGVPKALKGGTYTLHPSLSASHLPMQKQDEDQPWPLDLGSETRG